MINGRYENYELECIKKYLKNKIVVDVGAHIGNHSIYFSKYAKKVYSFEANPKTYEILELNTKKYSNIKTFNLGISNIHGSGVINNTIMNIGATKIVKKKLKNNLKIKLTTLDKLKFLSENKINLIKLDIEGHELFALRGMSKILKKQKPNLILEYNNNNPSNKKVIKYLRELGYKSIYILVRKPWSFDYQLPRFFKFILKILEIIFIGAPEYKFVLKKSKNLPEGLKSNFFLMVS